MPKTLKTQRKLELAYDIPVEKTSTFWDKLEDGEIYTTKCKECGKLYFPPQADCPECLKSDMDWVKLSKETEIEAFTHIWARPASFQEYEPYTVAVGRLKKEGIKVLAWMEGFKKTEVKVGTEAELVAGTTPEGNPTYKFVPRE